MPRVWKTKFADDFLTSERTSAVISGMGSSDSDDSTAAYQWSLDNPDNINVSIENPTQANAKLV